MFAGGISVNINLIYEEQKELKGIRLCAIWLQKVMCYLPLVQSSHKKNTSLKPQTSKNLFRPVKICDGLVEFKHDYRETRVWNSDSG